MDRVHSYEQRSISELGLESGGGQNRLIIVNRREPDLLLPINDTHPRLSNLKSYFNCFGLFEKQVSRRGNFGHRVRSNQTVPTDDEGPFASNEWRTSKYTLLNFLPKNLFEQFRRLANFYFLATAVLQFLVPLSPVGPATSLLPLIFVVSSSAIKQAYEDYLRHRLDEQVNNAQFHILRDKKLAKIHSKDIKVGDFVYVRNNEEIPCDMILLDTSGIGGKCFLTTANLDGETSLKGRSCFQIREQVGDIEKLDSTLLAVECENPNATLYEFNGVMCIPKDAEAYKKVIDSLSSQKGAHRRKNLSIMQIIFRSLRLHTRSSSDLGTPGSNFVDSYETSHLSQIASSHEIPLDINNLLLRASRLRNTAYIYGLAIYTGKDTKLAHNSQLKSNKFSSLEKRVNLFLLIAFSILLLFSFVGALLHDWDSEKLKQQNKNSFLLVFVAHFLLYNYMIPISLYVTLEFVKFFGTSAVVEDKKMKYPIWKIKSVNQTESKDEKRLFDHQSTKSTNRSMRFKSNRCVLEGPRCNSSDLNEELGQVQVLFSDKTGTLTENKMRFMACSIYGDLYRHLDNNLYQQPAKLFTSSIPDVVHKLEKMNTGRQASLATNQSHKPKHKSKSLKSPVQLKSTDSQDSKPFDHQKVPPLEQLKLINVMEDNEQVAEFFICLCLCSTLTLNEKKEVSACLTRESLEELNYQSASPDEESLISAAHQYGISLCKSDDQDCYIAIRRASAINKLISDKSTSDGKNKLKYGSDRFKPLVNTKYSNDKYIVRHFQRLIVLEFDSTRKRMSVIYRDCDTNCFLMVSKGSESLLDCIKLDEISAKDKNCINVTLAHFEAFAVSGLRTLLVARRILTKQEFDQIKVDMSDARLSLQNRDSMMSKLYQRTENNLKLIGTTAVEDTLQDGVPETIANLKEAGIKIWLLTGDKVETAISVAYLCKLLDHEMTVIHLVRQQDSFSCQHFLANITQRMKHPIDDQGSDIEENSSFLTRVFRNLSGQPANSGHPKARRYALIADGRSLHFAMKYAKKELSEICASCICVLGCRLSPLQKAEVVAMVKGDAARPITAAIGDGANDVSMIQEAHVGIGVSGKEGRQAVNSGDFAISRFYMLSRLLFVHGHLFYHRASNTINYFFYKNLLFVLPQFYYSLHNPGAVISLYHPILLISFNLLFTSLPILLYGLFEVHILEVILENYPKLYQINKCNRGMQLSVFFFWLASATIQATISYYLLYYNWSTEPFYHGEKKDGVNGFALMIYFIVILLATCNLFLVSKSHNLAFIGSELFSFLSLPLFLYCYSLVDWSYVFSNNSFYGDFTKYLKSPLFWISILIITVAALAPTIIWYVRDRVLYFRRLNLVLDRTTVAN